MHSGGIPINKQDHVKALSVRKGIRGVIEMKKETRAKLELFMKNIETIRKGISMTSGEDRRMAALLYTLNGKKMDRGKIEESYAVLKKGAGALSSFRASTPLSVAAMISLRPDPKNAFDSAKDVYGKLRDIKFRSSEFLANAAIQIAAGSEPKDHQVVVNRMRSFFDKMKSNNWLHTGADDYVFAALFALSGANEKAVTDSIGEFYQKLTPEFKPKGSVLALAQVLAIGGQNSLSVGRVVALRDSLKEKKIRLDRSYSVPTLGILSSIPADARAVAQEIEEAAEFLRAQPGMGKLSASDTEIHLYAASAVAAVYANEMQSGMIAASLSTVMTNIVIAQTMLMIIIIAASAGAIAAMSS